ncbi:MAG: hypothetical protein PVG26_04805, partial [Desulfobacterales bacterium]
FTIENNVKRSPTAILTIFFHDDFIDNSIAKRNMFGRLFDYLKLDLCNGCYRSSTKGFCH